MAAASYTTDLTELAEANETNDTGTWAELNGHTGGSAAGDETDYFIQGTSCISQQLGTKTGTQAGIQYDHGAAVTLGTGTDGENEVISLWSVLLAGNAIETFTNGGMRGYFGSSSGNVKIFKINGSDFNRNPYGGWINVAVDPTNTGDYTNEGSPSGTDWRLVGTGPNLTAAVSKGYMHAIDRIMYGRCEYIVTDGDLANGYATFDGMATENDYNDATNGYNRWGLFSLQGGTYLWKGLMSLGTTGTAVDFRDANRSIIIDQTPKTYAAFNRIEIRNSSSNVEWTNINITAPTDIPSGESAILAKGEFEVIDNATILQLGCVFTDMSTFTYNGGTNANTLTRTTWRRCDTVTQGGALMNGCTLDDTTSTTAALVSTAATLGSAGSNSPNTFIGDGTTTPGHAVSLGSVTGGTSGSPLTINWYNVLDNGTTNQSVWEGSTQSSTGGTQGTANSAITMNIAAGTYVKISVASGATIPTVQNTGTGFLEITANEVTLTITVKDIDTGSVIEGAMVYVTNVAETATYINKVETNASGQVSHTTSLGSAQPLAGVVRAATPASKAYTKYYKSAPVAGTFSNTQDTDITIQLIPDQ